MHQFNNIKEFLDEITRAYENPDKFLRDMPINQLSNELDRLDLKKSEFANQSELQQFIKCVSLLEDSTTKIYK